MKPIAAVVTEYRYLSHAQVICDRFLSGYALNGQPMRTNAKIVSMYVDQFPDNDLSRERAERFGFNIHPTIPSALRNGGHALAVEGVLLIAEHGQYPQNELGQTLYPRHEFFRQIVKTFQQDQRTAPVFVDKHLSYEFEKAERMARESKRGNFALMAGSSIPVAIRLPPLELPLESELEEALAVGYGGLDSYDFHALEGLQCMTERRKGGETGVQAVEYLEGEEVWKAGDEGVWSWELLESAVSRSDTPQGNAVEDGRPENLVGLGYARELAKNPCAYILHYADGLRASMLMLNGAANDFLFAARLRGEPAPVSTQFFLTPTPGVHHFSGLVHKIDEMFETGAAPYPADRTLLVSGVMEACLKARHAGVRRLETPELLKVQYQPSAESYFMRC